MERWIQQVANKNTRGRSMKARINATITSNFLLWVFHLHWGKLSLVCCDFSSFRHKFSLFVLPQVLVVLPRILVALLSCFAGCFFVHLQ